MLHICYHYSLKTPNWILKIYDIYKGLHGVKKKISAANKTFSSIRSVPAVRGAWRAVGGASLLPTEECGELGGSVLGSGFSFPGTLNGTLNTFC